MTPANSSVSQDGKNLQSVARIDALSEQSAFPLRDFFTEYGYLVIINQTGGVQEDYHVIFGDEDYVKKIVADLGKPTGKRLAVVYGEMHEEIFPAGFSGKVVLVDEPVLSKEMVTAIFRFFFTSKNAQLDLRKNPKKHASGVSREKGKPTPHVTTTWQKSQSAPGQYHTAEAGVDDAARIRTIMASVFGPLKKQKRRKPRIRLTFASVFVLLLLPFFWYIVTVGVSVAALGYAGFMLRAGRISSANFSAELAVKSSGQSERTLHAIAAPFVFAGAGQLLNGQEHMVSFLSDMSASLVGVSNIFLTSKSAAGLLLSKVGGTGSLTSPAQQVGTLRRDLFRVQTNIGLAASQLQAMLRERSFPFWFAYSERLGERMLLSLNRYNDAVGNVDKFLTLYPYMSGFRQKQTFLVLFQNSLELRPTGGFIGTIGILTTEEGTVSNFEITDVYVVDGQLKGHVDPPTPMRELMGLEHWYLRDSNWDPNFAVAASRAAWFYEKETGVRVDGVIGMNTPLVVRLLAVTGPISLRDYNDRITSQNFYGKTLFYTAADFFPGSTQKQNFLGSLARALMDGLVNNKTISPTGLFRVVTDSLASHDILFYFADPELNQLVSQFGWSTRVFNRSGCEGVSRGACFFNPLAINEANLGVNKVNYFVNRSIERTIDIQPDGTVSEATTLSLQNTSRGKPQDSGGPYRLYLRYFLASDATIDRVDLDGAAVPFRTATNTPSLSTLPYAEYPEPDTGLYRTLGIAVEIPSGAGSRITVVFKRNARLPLGQGGAILEPFTQMQPGLGDTPLRQVVRYPPTWDVRPAPDPASESEKQFLAKEGSLTYNTTLSRDRDLRILVRK